MTLDNDIKLLYLEYIDFIISEQRIAIMEKLNTQNEKMDILKSYDRLIYYSISKRCIDLCNENYSFYGTRTNICYELKQIHVHIDKSKELLQLCKYDYLQIAITSIINKESSFFDVYKEEIQIVIDSSIIDKEFKRPIKHSNVANENKKVNMEDLRSWFKKNAPEEIFTAQSVYLCYVNDLHKYAWIKKANINIPNYSLLQVILKGDENEVLKYRIVPMKKLSADVKNYFKIKYWTNEKEIL